MAAVNGLLMISSDCPGFEPDEYMISVGTAPTCSVTGYDKRYVLTEQGDLLDWRDDDVPGKKDLVLYLP